MQACGDEESVRESAIAALEEMGPPRTDAAQPLSELAADTNELVAYWAVTLLGRLGLEAKSVAPALVSVLESSSHLAVRQRAAWALGQIKDGGAATVAALERAKHAADPRLARLASQALGQLQGTV